MAINCYHSLFIYRDYWISLFYIQCKRVSKLAPEWRLRGYHDAREHNNHRKRAILPIYQWNIARVGKQKSWIFESLLDTRNRMFVDDLMSDDFAILRRKLGRQTFRANLCSCRQNNTDKLFPFHISTLFNNRDFASCGVYKWDLYR